MSAQDPLGTQKFWFNGLPYPGLAIGSREIRTLKFWFNGLPAQTLFPNTVVPPSGKKNPPGQQKKTDAYMARLQLHRLRRVVRRKEGASAAFIPAEYLSPGSKSTIRGIAGIDWRQRVKTISISPSGHTVSTEED